MWQKFAARPLRTLNNTRHAGCFCCWGWGCWRGCRRDGLQEGDTTPPGLLLLLGLQARRLAGRVEAHRIALG